MVEVVVVREKYRLFNNEFVKLNGVICNIEDIFKNMEFYYGLEGEWKKFDGICVDKVVGEWVKVVDWLCCVYEVVLVIFMNFVFLERLFKKVIRISFLIILGMWSFLG